jgi:hypothetical protein
MDLLRVIRVFYSFHIYSSFPTGSPPAGQEIYLSLTKFPSNPPAAFWQDILSPQCLDNKQRLVFKVGEVPPVSDSQTVCKKPKDHVNGFKFFAETFFNAAFYFKELLNKSYINN